MRDVDIDIKQIQERIDQRQEHDSDGDGGNPGDYGNRKMPNESQRDFLIRTGKITPFSKMPLRQDERHDSSLQGVLLNAEVERDEEELEQVSRQQEQTLSHRNLVQPGFSTYRTSGSDDDEKLMGSKKRRKRRRLNQDNRSGPESIVTAGRQPTRAEKRPVKSHDQTQSDSDSEYQTEGGPNENSSRYSDSDGFVDEVPTKKAKVSKVYSEEESEVNMGGLDDGDERHYQQRLQLWTTRRRQARQQASSKEAHGGGEVNDGSPMEAEEALASRELRQEFTKEEYRNPHPTLPDTVLDGGLRIPGDIFPALFDYQKTGVRWLWELYSQKVGGIVGDEMGLGKTIQAIAFLAGLHHSDMLQKPVLVVAPATVMKQWVNEFHTWWPPFRVSILHSSGSGMVDLRREVEEEDDLLSRKPAQQGKRPPPRANKSARKIVDRVKQEGHILVTTYTGLQTYAELLIPTQWEYVVLDEGHKIRNPNISITIYCKELRTPNRIILSGTPMQNNLVELWSLFDFIFPMRLGTLVNFRQQFEFPIRQGGYANASNLQVQTALKCAETLKDAISPYLLQRFKADVAADLPKKSEQVLFCKLTKPQRDAYEDFLASDELRAIMAGKRQVLYGIDILRKICNHPDLQDHKRLSQKMGYNYGSGTKSGKMQVVKALLELWREQGHRTLLFAQHRIMLDILEKFVRSMSGFNYRRMDGTTPIQARQGMVDEFNKNTNAHVFLLTTKVGGLGINLTGADRVIIFDPDWNPSTDIQARERAWRLGQKRDVMIYRLMTSGTIEEKIYHRQLFKQFLINKILRDPKQRQTFQMKDLHDLFTLGGADEVSTETGGLFQGTEVQFGTKDKAKTPSVANGISLQTEPRTKQGMGEETDVRTLNGVASMEHFAGEEEEDQNTIPGDAANSEARVMESIFARSGVHAALEHDQIVNGKRVIAADPQMIEHEAKRVASQAARELRKAGEAAKNIPIGTPTWTGLYGTAGRPDEQRNGFNRGRGAPASNRLLTGLQSHQAARGLSNGSRSSTPDVGNTGARGPDFITMIRDYLMAHGGEVHTQMLIDHFNRYCTTPQRTAEFKAMLTEIAVLQKGSQGRGKWSLKEEYQISSRA